MNQTAATIPTLEPGTADELAAMLRVASERRQSLVIRGAGTKMGWGRPAQRIAAILSTSRLNQVLAHQHGDLTATVEAGATLRDVNDALARHGQCLPLDPPFADRATIGGILATNDSGPLRHRFGTPRDLVIGVRLATADGALARAGGQVVKNVAGYDLSKLVSGSFGSLAAIVSATFKLAPLPAASKTIGITLEDLGALGRVVRDVMASQLEPIAFDIHVRSTQSAQSPQRTTSSADVAAFAIDRPLVLLRFASLPSVVDAQIEQVSAIVSDVAPLKRGPAEPTAAPLKPGPPKTTIIEGDAERVVWDEHSRRVWDSPGAVLCASWLPANIADAIVELRRIARSATVEAVGRAAVGAGLIRIDADARTQAAAIERLRASAGFAHVVIARGSDELKALADVWGPQSDRARLFASLKRALDPHGVLNAGRGPL